MDASKPMYRAARTRRLVKVIFTVFAAVGFVAAITGLVIAIATPHREGLVLTAEGGCQAVIFVALAKRIRSEPLPHSNVP
jgi:hypothetical protein